MRLSGSVRLALAVLGRLVHGVFRSLGLATPQLAARGFLRFGAGLALVLLRLPGLAVFLFQPCTGFLQPLEAARLGAQRLGQLIAPAIRAVLRILLRIHPLGLRQDAPHLLRDGLLVAVLIQGCIAGHLAAVQRDPAHLGQPCLPTQPQHVHTQPLQGGQVGLPKIRNRAEVGLLVG